MVISAQTPTGFAPVTEKKLKTIAHKIAQETGAVKIILFGSYALGEATSDSDVDLLVIMETNLPPAERRISISRLLRPRPFPVDILVYTPSEIQQRITEGDPFIKQLLEEGVTLYARR